MSQFFLNDVDELSFELECALDNLDLVHTVMVDEKGINWEICCNAIFSTYLQLRNIHAELTQCVDRAITEEQKHRGKE